MKATCWKLHGKPADWKPSNRQDRDSHANAATSTETSVESSPFTREQIEALQKMFSQASSSTQTYSSHAEQHASLLAHQGTPSLVFCVQNNQPRSWIVDSGASYHMTEDSSILTDFQPCSSHSGVRIADGTISPVASIDSIHITEDLHLSSVLYVPKLNYNLLSISQITRDLNCLTKFHFNACAFQAVDSGKVVGSADMHGGLYLLKQKNLQSS